nr:hypothetical protein [Tanacetum cinerariifolium]
MFPLLYILPISISGRSNRPLLSGLSLLLSSSKNDHVASIKDYEDYQTGNVMISQMLKAYYEDVRISHQTSVARSQQQNSVVIRRNWSLVQAVRMIRHNKTPYEIIHDKKPDLTYFHVFGALCYPTNDAEDLGKLKPKADIGIFVGYAPGLMHNPPSTTPYFPPTKNDYDLLFQPMFDEYFNPPLSVFSPVPTTATPRPTDLTDSPSSTTINQAAPSVERMVYPILNPTEGKMLVVMDDKHVFGMIGDVLWMNHEHWVVDRIVVDTHMVDEHLVPKKIVDESLAIWLKMVDEFCIYMDSLHIHSNEVHIVD